MKSRVTKKTHYLHDISYCFLISQFLVIFAILLNLLYASTYVSQLTKNLLIFIIPILLNELNRIIAQLAKGMIVEFLINLF